jgi:hypothetical protein
MRLPRILPVAVLSVLVGLPIMSCMAVTTPAPGSGPAEDVKTQTLNTLDSLQEAGQQGAAPAELQSLAGTLKQQLTSLCSPFSLAENQDNVLTTTLSVQTAPAPIAPQSALPNQEITATRSAEEYEEGLEQTHRAPDPAELQTRRASSAATEQCLRAMELLATIDNTLTAEDFDPLALVDVVAELKTAVEEIPG